ncbi:Hypothetical predicted protein [Podarcis lilfordi]|uniref:Uncharacterized protein n=1 Tax=Podarcis lilfordi TaxID=74358 RepID=A0AA35KIV9_9SAUR|nr:Hypothetical predicted protein [Podarcis lilfordi]
MGGRRSVLPTSPPLPPLPAEPATPAACDRTAPAASCIQRGGKREGARDGSGLPLGRGGVCKTTARARHKEPLAAAGGSRAESPAPSSLDVHEEPCLSSAGARWSREHGELQH